MSVWLPRQSLPSSLLTRRVFGRHVHPRVLTVYHLAQSSRTASLTYPLLPRQFSTRSSLQAENQRKASTSSTPEHSQLHDGPTAEPKNPLPPTTPPAKDISVAKAPLATRVWKKVKHEAQHYWHGSKLLVSEVRISARLQWKLLHGASLTRRERRQVSRKPCDYAYFSAESTFRVVETHDPRLASAHTIRRLCHRTLYGTFASCRTEAVPKYAAFNV
jgi:LETM1 and EF-hand domain-containing protein 1, mitochondrial